MLTIAVLALATTGVAAAPDTGTLERIKVPGPSLQGNLEGDDPNRDVVVYLPPGYAKQAPRRYPVIYYLHGYLAHAENYVSTLGVPGSIDRAIAGGAKQMIVVFPDAYTVYSGSMFSNSPTTGDWEAFIAVDLVSYVDKHYRTVRARASRGLAGHSMGGYGTLRIGMKYPQVFGALYAASSCCVMNSAPATGPATPGAGGPSGPAPQPAAGGPPGAGPAAAAGAGAAFANALKAQAAAWAPDPQNAPDYFDLPATAGDRAALVAARWPANSPLVMASQYVPALRRYNGAIKMDVGDKDTLGAGTTPLDAELTRLGVKHIYEMYDGDHMNRIPQRFADKVLPFFSGVLK
ncbi:MAG TPA: alpha/beta hydrolase-fold protein [Steroidobacteraceae bacterium]|nr:alpha/beta hydrolase-fold protein [Steroidobacteraceae bacterium]